MTACKDCKHLIKLCPYGYLEGKYLSLECRVSPKDPEFNPYEGEFTIPKEPYKSVYTVNFGNCPKFERA